MTVASLSRVATTASFSPPSSDNTAFSARCSPSPCTCENRRVLFPSHIAHSVERHRSAETFGINASLSILCVSRPRCCKKLTSDDRAPRSGESSFAVCSCTPGHHAGRRGFMVTSTAQALMLCLPVVLFTMNFHDAGSEPRAWTLLVRQVFWVVSGMCLVKVLCWFQLSDFKSSCL